MSTLSVAQAIQTILNDNKAEITDGSRSLVRATIGEVNSPTYPEAFLVMVRSRHPSEVMGRLSQAVSFRLICALRRVSKADEQESTLRFGDSLVEVLENARAPSEEFDRLIVDTWTHGELQGGRIEDSIGVQVDFLAEKY